MFLRIEKKTIFSCQIYFLDFCYEEKKIILKNNCKTNLNTSVKIVFQNYCQKHFSNKTLIL